MPADRLSRRQFVAAGTAAATALGLRSVIAQTPASPGERINVGCIGVGGRGTNHMEMLKALSAKCNVSVVAVCDVWKKNLDAAAAKVKEWFGAEPKKFTRFGEMLQMPGLDAVTIATPDFSHGPILVAALKAGKDVYVEKPMTIQLEYANEALDVARAKERVVQVGTQYRSQPALIGVAKEVATGVLGKISRVSSAAGFNHPRWLRGKEDCTAADVDWDAYLLNLPKRPFDPSLLREWQLHAETSNGLPGLWMTHYVDATHLMLSLPYPVSAVAHGGKFVWKDRREHTDTFTALIEYPDGPLYDWSMNLANDADWHYGIYGVDGMIAPGGGQLSSRDWEVSKKGGARDSKVETRKIEPVPTNDHMENWLECIRSRQRPRADIQFGHQHAVASILSAKALESGWRQVYDADKREIHAG